MTSEELIDALNAGIIRSIQTSGRTLPSSAIPELAAALAEAVNDYDPSHTSQSSSTFQCQWIEYSTDLCDPVVEDIRTCLSNATLDGNELFGSDGRPLLYNACLGRFDALSAASLAKSSSLDDPP